MPTIAPNPDGEELTAYIRNSTNGRQYFGLGTSVTKGRWIETDIVAEVRP